MTNVLILGANGHIATFVRQQLQDEPELKIRLFVRNPNKLENFNDDEVVQGDATDPATLVQAMTDIDIVYSNLGTPLIEEQAKCVIDAARFTKIKHLIWISTLGIYDEVPGEFGRYNTEYLNNGGLQSYLATEARAATTIKKGGVPFTIIRPAWLTDNNDIDFETTEADEPFRGTVVSRRSVASFITHIIKSPHEYQNRSIGVNKPNTNGNRPQWY